MREHLDRAFRRLQLMVGVGRTQAATSDGGSIQTVQIKLQPDNAVRDGTKVLQLYGFSSSMPVGSDVVVLFLGGDRSNGVIVGTANQTARRRGLMEGEVSLHALGMDIHLSAAGFVIDAGGMPITFKNGTKARFEMPIESISQITGNCDGAAVHLLTHTHVDSKGGETSTPQG